MHLSIIERVKGIEPSSSPWEGDILPVYYTRETGQNLAVFPRRFSPQSVRKGHDHKATLCENYTASISKITYLYKFKLSRHHQDVSCMYDVRVCQAVCLRYIYPAISVSVFFLCDIPQIIPARHGI